MLCRPTDAPPKLSALAACRPRLLEEVQNSPRRVILALGNSAVRSLTGNTNLKISQVRGKVIQTPYGLVVPTFHPAALLRNNGEYGRWFSDVQYVAALLNGTKPKDPGKVRKWVIRSSAELRRVVDFLVQQPLLAADIETTGFNPRNDRILCLAVSWAKNKAVVIPLDAKYLTYWKWRPTAFLDNPQLRRLLCSPGPKWVWHNGKFDASFFHAHRLPARVDHDCMLMHYALNEQRGTHDLKQLAQDLLGSDDYSQALKPYVPKRSDSFAKIPPLVLFEYGARDVDSTFQIYGILEKEVSRPRNVGLDKLYSNLFIPVSAFLEEVEAQGVWVAGPQLDQLERELMQELGAKLRQLTEIATEAGWNPQTFARETGAVKTPRDFNPGSPKQVLWLLRKLGYNPKDRKGKVTTNQTVLRDVRPRHKFISGLLSYRNTSKALSTYAYGIRDAIDNSDGRVHSTYLIHGTTTGRLSSRNPNMQNIPRTTSGRWGQTIRNIFQAPPGALFLEFDYSQVELRVLALLSGDPELIRVYTEGRDLHDEVALALFGPGFDKEERVRAKFVNFGIAYGRGADSIAAEFKIPRAEGASMIRGWFERFPVAHKYLMEQRQAVVDGRTLASPFGRRRRFGLVTRETLNTLQNEAANFAIQSTASDLTLISGMRIQPYLKSFSGKVVNLVHDSILVEVPEGYDTGRIGQKVRNVMSETPKRLLHTDIPFEVSMTTGTAWGALKEG